MLYICQEIFPCLQANSSWNVAKQGMCFLSHLFSSFHSGSYISSDIWRAIAESKYKFSTIVGLRHPVIDRHAWSSCHSRGYVYDDRVHTGAVCSAVGKYRDCAGAMIYQFRSKKFVYSESQDTRFPETIPVITQISPIEECWVLYNFFFTICLLNHSNHF